MGKRKLQFFKEIKEFTNVTEFEDDEATLNALKGNWNRDIFNNENPVVLELACGKGDYTISMAQAYPDKNFIGIDIKGDRIHRGAKVALDLNLKNVHFLRIDIIFLNNFFIENEVDEIWITFPDPHLRGKNRENRLTSPKHLNVYKQALKNDGFIHLKTDSKTFYNYTLYTINDENLTLIYSTDDLYRTDADNPFLTGIQTYYEEKYLSVGKKITYIKFKL